MADPPVIDLTSTQPTQSKSSHRLPTVSASQALQDLGKDASSCYITTGITALDRRLSASSDPRSGGFERGKVTEIWGPSGGGKTAIALQAAANAVAGGSTVVWLDAESPLNSHRKRSIFSLSGIYTALEASEAAQKRFHHYTLATLSHLLALLLHPPPKFLPPDAIVLIIDGLNQLIDIDYPRYQIANTNKSEAQKWQAGRRYALLGSLISALNKIATINNVAVVVSTGCSTRMRHDSGLSAALVPGLGGVEWDGGVWTRLVVFRDFGTRFVGVQKCHGRSVVPREEVGEPGHVIGFHIDREAKVVDHANGGISADVSLPPQPLPQRRPSPEKARKRTIDEVADSEGEDVDEYGWAEIDEDAFVGQNDVGDGQTADSALR